MKDYIVRAVTGDASVRAFAIRSTDLVEEARRIHQTTPVVTAALGRFLSAGAMMATMMQGEKDILTLQIKADGPIRNMIVTADSHGNVKGYAANPDVIIPLKSEEHHKLDVGGAVGKGTLSVIMDLGLKEPYSGQVELATGEIGDDMAYYFTVSEQTPSAVGLGVMVDTDRSVKNAGGFIVQLMPNTPEEVIARLEQNIAAMPSVTEQLEDGKTPEEILERVTEGLGLEITDRSDVRFHCNCSKERVSRALATIREEDLQEMIDDGEETEVKCFFCNSAYHFSVSDLKEILAGRKKEAPAENEEDAPEEKQ